MPILMVLVLESGVVLWHAERAHARFCVHARGTRARHLVSSSDLLSMLAHIYMCVIIPRDTSPLTYLQCRSKHLVTHLSSTSSFLGNNLIVAHRHVVTIWLLHTGITPSTLGMPICVSGCVDVLRLSIEDIKLTFPTKFRSFER